MKNYCPKLKSYFDDLAAKKPAPGGGSAAALLFSAGTGLIEMSMQYSLKDNPGIIKEITNLRKKNFPVIDLDSRLFADIMKAKGKKRDALILKSEQMVSGLGVAAIKALKMALSRKADIKKSIISDYFIGIDCLKVVLSACVLNLKANEEMFKVRSRYISIFETELETWPKF